MTLYVYDPLLVRIGIVEDISSLQWLSEYQNAGEVKLVCSVTEKNRALLALGNRLYCTEQPESAIIEHWEITDDGKNAQLTVRALLSVTRWERRVVMATEHIGNAEAGMLALARKHRRGLQGGTAAAKGIAVSANTQVTWGSVLDAQITIATATGLGFKETFAPDTGRETFEVYQGTDRTSGAQYAGYFGDDVANLSALKIVDGMADWCNVAIVSGKEDENGQKVVTVNLDNYRNDNRREMWVDAKDISTTYQVATETGEMDKDGNPKYKYTQQAYTDAEYEALLYTRGVEKLVESMKTQAVEAELGQGLMEYGKDYFLGDIVPIKVVKYGLRIFARVSAVRTIYESSGKKVTAILSEFNFEKEA